MNYFRSLICAILICAGFGLLAQNKTLLTEKEAVEQALKGNPVMKIASLKVEKQKTLKASAINFNNLELLFQSPYEDQMRPGLLQQFAFPTTYYQQIMAQKSNINVASAEKSITTNNLIFVVRTNYNMLNFLTEKYNTLRRQDSVFSDILVMNETRYRVGQISNLEKINGEAYYKQIKFNLLQTMADFQNNKIQLSILVGKPEDTTIVSVGKLNKIIDYEVNQLPDTSFETNPLTTFYSYNKDYSKRQLKVERNKRIPGLVIGYLNQGAPETSTYYRLQFGLSLPIWYWTYHSKIASAKKEVEIVQTQATLNNYQLKGEYSKELAQLRNYSNALEYFETIGLAQSTEILKSARESYRLGSIGYYFYLQNINQAFQIQLNYLEALKNYNQSIITLQYLLGDQKY